MDTNQLILKLLNKRGIKGNKNIQEFLSPKPHLTFDPFLLKNMQEGVGLIVDTLKKGENICIYGDYDADGVTSTTILKSLLEEDFSNISYYIPSRFDDGYGLNKEAIKEIADSGAKLIITVDCGITSIQEIEYAKSLGLKVLVTDHHTPGEEIPDCLVINPKQKGDEYPFKDLAGCGVAFKLAQGLQRTLNFSKSKLNKNLDMVALGTIGDIVPLVSENRTLAKYGINQIMASKRPGLTYLIKRLFPSQNMISSDNIAYGIVPHLNAAGRMEHASLGVELFMVQDQNEIVRLTDDLIRLNTERKAIQEETYKECVQIYEKDYTSDKFPIIIMKDAHEGITGIVAGKMKDYTHKPVAILTEEGEDYYKGTARSVENIDLYEVLNSAAHLFKKFGGHKGACGFTIKKENIKDLKEIIEKTMDTLNYNDISGEISYDLEIKGQDISLELGKELQKLEPFGFDNEKPIFKLKNCYVKSIFEMREKRQHIKFAVDLPGFSNLDCLYFNYDLDKRKLINIGQPVDIVGSFDVNQWNGREKLQVMVLDLI